MTERIEVTTDQDVVRVRQLVRTVAVAVKLSLVDQTKDRQGELEDMVVGEAVFGEILALFRRLGHEHYNAQSQHDNAAV